MSAVLKLRAENCDLKYKLQVVHIQNITSGSLSVLPDVMELRFAGETGWHEVPISNEEPEGGEGGCPIPLPPGSACAITGDLERVWSMIQAGKTYDAVRLSWSVGEFDAIEEGMPEVCEL